MKKHSIFISYSHRDESWKKLIVKHLNVLNLNCDIEFWDDRRIVAGSKWKNEILDAINKAAIAILLISADFLTSKFINDVEVPIILKREEEGLIRIVPILIRDCSYENIEWLSNIQMRPKDAKPLATFQKNLIESEITIFSKEIKKLIDIAKHKSKKSSNSFSNNKPERVKKNSMIPYLINRHDQLNIIKKGLTQSLHVKKNTNCIWIVHGEEDQCLPEFLKCLRKYYWKNIIHCNYDQAAIKPIEFNWPKNYESFEELKNLVFSEIKDKQAKNISDGDYISLSMRINSCYKGPIMISTIVYTDDFKTKKNIINDFIHLWSEWPQRRSGCFLVFCLVVKYFKDLKKS